MRILKTVFLSATFLLATASLAMACPGQKTAKAENASATTACASKAAVKTASAGCSATCTAKAENADMAQRIDVETVRLPSGTLAVFYNGTCPESTGYLQAAAAKGCEGFVCPLAQSMAKDANVHTEMAKTEHGVMILVTSNDAQDLDRYEAQYTMATPAPDKGAEE
jgi:hypothetical protein